MRNAPPLRPEISRKFRSGLPALFELPESKEPYSLSKGLPPSSLAQIEPSPACPARNAEPRCDLVDLAAALVRPDDSGITGASSENVAPAPVSAASSAKLGAEQSDVKGIRRGLRSSKLN